MRPPTTQDFPFWQVAFGMASISSSPKMRLRQGAANRR